MLPAGRRGDQFSGLIASVSTLLFLGLIVLAVVLSPGWDEVKQQFFDGEQFRTTFPAILDAFGTTVKIFLIAEALVLVLGLVIALVRMTTTPVLFPLRVSAIIYTDVMRGIPMLLLVYLLGFGVPGLGIDGVPTSPIFWGIAALVLAYSAYVAEVFRAGIESIHPSQEAAARAIGLTRLQALRFVVLPQAVRRVIPPLLNDFISLQKDSALIGTLGVVEALRQAQIETSASFNYTPYIVAAMLFLALTIPLTRLTDWLVSRERRRHGGGRR